VEILVMNPNARPLVSAGTVLGIGLGGFVDGILFHQLLQLHNMLTGWVPKDTIPNIEVNMFWDGLFHALTWVTTAAGLAMLFRAGERPDVPWSRRVFGGALVLGWGLFNLVEGVIDHHVLGVHHVVESAGLSIFDWTFLASGVVFIAAGWFAIQGADATAPVTRPSSPHAPPVRS
jgi:uncharacterized membrane protein